MDDNTRAALDAEAPVNPYSLLDAVNTASQRCNTMWLVFLGAMAYAALAVASLSHRDLLLDGGILLPLLQVRIDIVRFFLFVPAVFVLLHVMVVTQFALLARKALEFDAALRLLESTDLRSHPLRLELDSFFFAQTLAGPERSRVLGAFLHAIGWLTLLILPLLLLLWMQVAVLPFHHAGVTAVQSAIVLADIVFIGAAGVFLTRTETTFFGALVRSVLGQPGSAVLALAVAASAAVFSVFVVRGGDGPLLGVFPRNLVITDATLASDRDVAGMGSINLRGRDLRFARLDRSDLRRADLTGANLDGASLRGADMRGLQLGCVDAAALQQADGRAKAGCATGRDADFSGARLSDAGLGGADLRGARFDGAAMDAIDLRRAILSGASLERARLPRADLSGAELQGARFVAANLQGAALAGAGLQMADFSGAALQGARLASSHLAGAVLREAELEGAELQQTRLYGADLRGARLQAADLAGAKVWRTVPPGGDATSFADLANITLGAPAADDVAALKAVLAALRDLPVGERAAGLEAVLEAAGADSAWLTSADGQSWAGLLRTSEAAMADGFRTRLSEHLADLACRTRFADGAVAVGVARRAASPAFKGDPAVLIDRLKAAGCPAGKRLPGSAWLDLAAAADEGRGP